MFITLTNTQNAKKLVNLNRVNYFEKLPHGTSIHFKGESTQVIETVSEIEKLIKEAYDDATTRNVAANARATQTRD